MSTDGVIEAIDGALSDWEVSDDAMRWTPDPPPPSPVLAPTLSNMGLTLGRAEVFAHPVGGNPFQGWRHVGTASAIRFENYPRPVMHPDVARALTEAGRRASEAFARMRPPLKVAGVAIRQMHEHMVEAGMIPAEPPTDPRERALWAVRNRNTGPARNPFTHRGIT